MAYLLIFLSSSPPVMADSFHLTYAGTYCMARNNGAFFPYHPSNGANVELKNFCFFSATGSEWGWIDGGSSGRLKSLAGLGSNKCLHKEGNDSPSNGDNVHLWDCGSSATPNSNWVYSSGLLRLAHTNLCVQKKGTSSPQSGHNLHLWDCDTGSIINKVWYQP